MSGEPEEAKWNAGSEEKGRWRAAVAERVPGCSWALLVETTGTDKMEVTGAEMWEELTGVSVPETPSVLDKHLPDKLSSGRGHIYLQFSREQTYRLWLVHWPTGNHPVLPDAQKGGKQVLGVLHPSFSFPSQGRILRNMGSYRLSLAHAHTHTRAEKFGQASSISKAQINWWILFLERNQHVPEGC